MSTCKKKHYHSHTHLGVNSIDYYAYTSKLRELNAGFKVGFSSLALVLCIAADHIIVSLFVITTMAILTVIIGKLSFEKYCLLLTIPLIFLIMGSIAIAVDFGKIPIGKWYVDFHYFFLYITKKNLVKAASVTCKALGAVSAMYMMTISTPVSEIIVVLRKIHVPKLIIELMNMIYRFIFIMIEVQHKMHNSAESRLGYVDFKTAINSFGSTEGNLLIVSMQKANVYYDALESRGYDGELRFLEDNKPCKAKHIVFAMIYFAGLIMIWNLSSW